MIETYFGVARAGSTVPRELRAGLTTILTMSYVLFVNPQVLGSAITGVDNPAALFGYIGVLNAGVAAVALRKRWDYLVVLAAAGVAIAMTIIRLQL